MPVVTVRGAAEVRKAFHDLAIRAPKQVAFINLKAAKLVAAEVSKEAPSGPHEGGGNIVPINQSIKVSSTALVATVTAGGPRTPHAAGSEFGGTIPRRGFKGIGRRTKRALRVVAGERGLTRLHRHPFLLPALEAKRAAVYGLYESMVSDLIARF